MLRHVKSVGDIFRPGICDASSVARQTHLTSIFVEPAEPVCNHCFNGDDGAKSLIVVSVRPMRCARRVHRP
jgi:hypothetical protein